jgi:iron complex outermembrane recepter protein
VQHWNFGERRSPRRGRAYALGSVAVALLAPAAGRAETTLPDINVIATTPLSGTRSPQRNVAPAPERPAPRATRAEPAAPSRATGARTTTTTRTTARAAPAAPAPAAPAPVQASAPADSSAIDRDKVPANTQVLTSEDFRHDRSSSFLEALSQSLPGVFIGDTSGNQFQRDVNYRGFVASPVQGTPQGLAVYQNGVRINEAYGDVVNWDFIPEMSIRKLSLVPNNPIFGLNAIGGALTIEMKNGFTYQGKEVEAMIGSPGH